MDKEIAAGTDGKQDDVTTGKRGLFHRSTNCLSWSNSLQAEQKTSAWQCFRGTGPIRLATLTKQEDIRYVESSSVFYG